MTKYVFEFQRRSIGELHVQNFTSILQSAYWKLLQGIAAMEEGVCISNLRRDELYQILQALIFDCPEITVYFQNLHMEERGQEGLQVRLFYTMSRKRAVKRMKQIHKRAERILGRSLLSVKGSDLTRAQAIAEELKRRVPTALPGDRKAVSTLACIRKGRATEKGAALALSYLLHQAQIPSMCRSGYADGQEVNEVLVVTEEGTIQAVHI